MHDNDCFIQSDSELVELIRRNDSRAFETVYHRYSAGLYFSAYNILRDKQVCEDAVQELFVAVWTKRHNLEVQSLKSYLYTAIRNRVLMIIRSGKVKLDPLVLEELAQKYPTDKQLIEGEINSLLERGVAVLPEKCRQIFCLSRQDQLSNKEIANLLNISVKTVENQLTIALRRLRAVMGDFLIFTILLNLF